MAVPDSPRFFSRFVSFQGFAAWKIFRPSREAPPLSTRCARRRGVTSLILALPLLPGRAKQGAEPANPISLRPRRKRRIQVIRPGIFS